MIAVDRQTTDGLVVKTAPQIEAELIAALRQSRNFTTDFGRDLYCDHLTELAMSLPEQKRNKYLEQIGALYAPTKESRGHSFVVTGCLD